MQSTTIEDKNKQYWLKRSNINQDPDYVQNLLRDASATVSSGNYLKQTLIGFNAESGTLSVGFKSCFAFEKKKYYPQVFQGITPSKPRNTIYAPTPNDARFYVNIRCPAGLVFKLEVIDGGKVCSIQRERALFPKLSEIIRFQQLRNVEQDGLRRVNETLFHVSRQRFLERVFWPETTNRLLNLQKRQKISSQLFLANDELESRDPSKEKKQTANSSFSTMSTDELTKWVQTATKVLKEDRRQSIVTTSCGTGQHPTLALLPDTPVRYSFVKYDENKAKTTHQTVWDSIHLSKHPTNLASMAQLGLTLPLSVECDTQQKSTPLLPTDNARYNKLSCGSVNELMHFLSFGTFKVKERSLDSVVVIDRNTQTID